VFHFSNLFLGQKELEGWRLVIWSIVVVERPVDGPKFRTFSLHSLVDCLAL